MNRGTSRGGKRSQHRTCHDVTRTASKVRVHSKPHHAPRINPHLALSAAVPLLIHPPKIKPASPPNKFEIHFSFEFLILLIAEATTCLRATHELHQGNARRPLSAPGRP
eukprot:scaffold115830_cov43-Phaeocystis_antarctica.AAC.2